MCRPRGKPVCYLKLGQKVHDEHAVGKPKEMHSLGGVLEIMPISAIHLPARMSKVARQLATTLTDEINCEGAGSSTASADNTDNDNDKGTMSVYINDLIEVVKHELLHASRQGSNYSFTQRAERMLQKAAVIAIKASLRDVFDTWIE